MRTLAVMHPAPAASIRPACFDSPLARPLVDEWRRLGADPRSRATVASWRLETVPPSCTDLDALLTHAGFGGRHDDDRADAVMLELVGLAATEQLAARVVLQRVLPPLIAAANRRCADRWQERPRAFGDLNASAWMVIRTYPVERRPRRVAANIVRDAEYLTFVQPQRLKSAGEVPDMVAVATERLADAGGRPVDRDIAPFELVVEVLSAARDHGFDDDDLRFAARLASGRSTDELAVEFGLRPRTVRHRRALVVSRLRTLHRALSAA